MAIENIVEGMSEEEVNKLPVKESPPNAYEHIKEKFTCPTCEIPLEPSRVEYRSGLDGINRSQKVVMRGGAIDVDATTKQDDWPTETKVILAAGCQKCSTLYRFEGEPIVYERKL